ncbi:MAG: radical SAM family heme chaperone HemW [Prevotella sp.]|nr:radical SAM family heme chaperone HemW [Prevotella sp.]
MTGLYIHIPFCASRCIYCGFYSTTLLTLQNDYVSALCREMEIRQKSAGNRLHVDTIYLGGGTPSQLSAYNLQRLFSYIYNMYDVDSEAEVTMECNPDDVTKSLLSGLPVNRVSMGIQTFSDDRLRFLRRRHTASQAERAIEILRKTGIGNISIDLMFGFPDETLEEWNDDISRALALKPEHISAYSLMYEEGTALGKMLEKGEVKEIDEELSASMYSTLIDRLCDAGYEHYEISNFALTVNDGKGQSKSLRSRHNSSYWQDKPYIGIGAAAHSYGNGIRSWNVSDIRKYMESIAEGVLPAESEVIDDVTHYNDIITTALRTKEGINIDELPDSQRQYILSVAEKHIAGELLQLHGNMLSLTQKGLFISDSIMADLIMEHDD